LAVLRWRVACGSSGRRRRGGALLPVVLPGLSAASVGVQAGGDEGVVCGAGARWRLSGLILVGVQAGGDGEVPFRWGGLAGARLVSVGVQAVRGGT